MEERYIIGNCRDNIIYVFCNIDDWFMNFCEFVKFVSIWDLLICFFFNRVLLFDWVELFVYSGKEGWCSFGWVIYLFCFWVSCNSFEFYYFFLRIDFRLVGSWVGKIKYKLELNCRLKFFLYVNWDFIWNCKIYNFKVFFFGEVKWCVYEWGEVFFYLRLLIKISKLLENFKELCMGLFLRG